MKNDFRRSIIVAAVKLADKLAREERRVDVKQKILATKDACEYLMKTTGTVSVPAVVSWIGRNRPEAVIAKQSFYNKNGQGQYAAYRQVFDAFAKPDIHPDVAAVKSSDVFPVPDMSPSMAKLFTEAELASISDAQLRYKIRTLISRASALQVQNTQLRRIGDQAKVDPHSGTLLSAPEKETSLTEDDIATIRSFLDSATRRSGTVFFDEDGAMVISIPASPKSSNRTVTDPLFKDALEKIVGKSSDAKIERL